jgi:hypothetical protein
LSQTHACRCRESHQQLVDLVLLRDCRIPTLRQTILREAAAEQIAVALPGLCAFVWVMDRR